MFPDEGDTERVQVKNLRVSQEWDEGTGEWSVKGTCDLSHLCKKKGSNNRIQEGGIANDERILENEEVSSGLSPCHTDPVVHNGPFSDDEIGNEAETDAMKGSRMIELNFTPRESTSHIFKSNNAPCGGRGDHVDTRIMLEETAQVKVPLSPEGMNEKGHGQLGPGQISLQGDSSNHIHCCGVPFPEVKMPKCSSRTRVSFRMPHQGQNDSLSGMEVHSDEPHSVEDDRNTSKDLYVHQHRVNVCHPFASSSEAHGVSLPGVISHQAIQANSDRLEEYPSVSSPPEDTSLHMGANGFCTFDVFHCSVIKEGSLSEDLGSNMDKGRETLGDLNQDDKEQSELPVSFLEAAERTVQTEISPQKMYTFEQEDTDQGDKEQSKLPASLLEPPEENMQSELSPHKVCTLQQEEFIGMDQVAKERTVAMDGEEKPGKPLQKAFEDGSKNGNNHLKRKRGLKGKDKEQSDLPTSLEPAQESIQTEYNPIQMHTFQEGKTVGMQQVARIRVVSTMDMTEMKKSGKFFRERFSKRKRGVEGKYKEPSGLLETMQTEIGPSKVHRFQEGKSIGRQYATRKRAVTMDGTEKNQSEKSLQYFVEDRSNLGDSLSKRKRGMKANFKEGIEIPALLQPAQEIMQTETGTRKVHKFQERKVIGMQQVTRRRAAMMDGTEKKIPGKSFQEVIEDRSKFGDSLLKRTRRVKKNADREEGSAKQVGSFSKVDAESKKWKSSDSSMKMWKKRGRTNPDTLIKVPRQGSLLQHENGRMTGRVSKAMSSLKVAEKIKSDSRRSTLTSKKGPRKSVLQDKVRCIAKAALLEAGFRIELRPRKNRDYLDSVYVSPQGSTFWSIPNAWRALKRMQTASAEKGEKDSMPKHSHNGGLACKVQRKGMDSISASTKAVDKRLRCSSSARLGANMKESCGTSAGAAHGRLLKLACEKVGISSDRALGVPLEEANQLQLTKSDLADLFLEKLGVLNRARNAKGHVASNSGNTRLDEAVSKVTKKAKASLSNTHGLGEPDGARGDQTSRSNKKPQFKTSKLYAAGNIVKKKEDEIERFISGKKSLATRVSLKHSSNKKPSKREPVNVKPYINVKENKKNNKIQCLSSGNKSFVTRGSCKPSSNKKQSQTEPVDLKSKPSIKVLIHKNRNGKVASALNLPMERRGKKSMQETGKRLKADRESSIQLELRSKKFQLSLKETRVSLVTSKKRKAASLDSLPSPQCKNKKGKVTSTKQTALQNKAGRNHEVHSGCRLVVRSSTRKGEGADSFPCRSKQTVLSWLIDRGVLSEREKLHYININDNEIMKEGLATSEGILCKCCKKIFAISSFKVHAGSDAYSLGQIIFLKNGKSLLDCQMQAWAIETQIMKLENYVGVNENDRNDDTCALCGDGGDLICCDNCPSTFHTCCLQIEVVPEGNWYCPKCCCAVCGGSQFSDDKEMVGDMKYVSICNQCEHQYHSSCLREGGVATNHHWFCGDGCEKIFTGLRSLIGLSHNLEGEYSWTLLKLTESYQEQQSAADLVIEAGNHSKLAVALIVMQECFVPMVDPRTNIDMIPHVLYNRWSEFDRLNYRGFYTVVLEKGDEVISVASIRVHGARLAEMPLIGTRQQYRRQGMCRRLVNAIEKMLTSLGVEKFVLPAIPELLETWTSAFGFQPVDSFERLSFRGLSMMLFPGTQLLQKPLQKVELVQANVVVEDLRDLDLENQRVQQISCTLDLSDLKHEVAEQFECDSFRLNLLSLESHANSMNEVGALEQIDDATIFEGEDNLSMTSLENNNQWEKEKAITSSPFIVECEVPVEGIEELQKEATTHHQNQFDMEYSEMSQFKGETSSLNDINGGNDSQNELGAPPKKVFDNWSLSAKKQHKLWNKKLLSTTCRSQRPGESSGFLAALKNLTKEVKGEGDMFLWDKNIYHESQPHESEGLVIYWRKEKTSTVQFNSTFTESGQINCSRDTVDVVCDDFVNISLYQSSDTRNELQAGMLEAAARDLEPYKSSLAERYFREENSLSPVRLFSFDSPTGRNIKEQFREGKLVEKIDDERLVDSGQISNAGNSQSADDDQLNREKRQQERWKCQSIPSLADDVDHTLSSGLRTQFMGEALKIASDCGTTSIYSECCISVPESADVLDRSNGNVVKENLDLKSLNGKLENRGPEENAFCDSPKFGSSNHSPDLGRVLD